MFTAPRMTYRIALGVIASVAATYCANYFFYCEPRFSSQAASTTATLRK
jgi:hypothetical protein